MKGSNKLPSMSAVEQAFCRSTPWRWATRRVIQPWALSGFSPHGNVLELGAGSGVMAMETARVYPDLHLTVTDIDHAMVRAARARLGRYPNVKVTRADVTDLKFEDQTFDVVTSFLMLHHVIDWERALREVARVLRPGGTLIGYDMTRTHFGELVHWVDRSPHRLLAREEFAPGLLEVGLRDVSVRPSFARHVVRFVGTRPVALDAKTRYEGEPL